MSRFQKAARNFRDASNMARANAIAARAEGDGDAEKDATARAERYEQWAERELLMERMSKEQSDDSHDIAA